MTPHIILLPTVSFAILTYVSAFKDGKPTCDKYILNTYMYSITYLLLLTYFVMLFAQYPKLIQDLNLLWFLFIALANIGLFFAIVYVSPQQYPLKHLLSLLYISSAGFLLSFVFALFGSKAVVYAAWVTVGLFILLSILAFRFQHMITSRVSLAMVVIFLIMILVELLVGMFYPSSRMEKAVILIVLMMVAYFVLVKTKRMIENKKTCETPDYVRESIGFIVSIQNIFVRVLRLGGRRRRF